MVSLRSKITRQILGYFFINPGQKLFVNEIERKFKADKRNLVRKLAELESEGLLKSEWAGNLRLYSINRKFPLYREYARIFMKTAGLERRLREIVLSVPGIREAYIFGSYARDSMHAHSDIDLLVVGSHSVVPLQSELIKIQRETDREVNCVHMSEEEFSRRRETGDPFLEGIFSHPRIRLAPCEVTQGISSNAYTRQNK